VSSSSVSKAPGIRDGVVGTSGKAEVVGSGGDSGGEVGAENLPVVVVGVTVGTAGRALVGCLGVGELIEGGFFLEDCPGSSEKDVVVAVCIHLQVCEVNTLVIFFF
jgi:hypothetical protein